MAINLNSAVAGLPQRHSREGGNPFPLLEQALIWGPVFTGTTLRIHLAGAGKNRKAHCSSAYFTASTAATAESRFIRRPLAELVIARRFGAVAIHGNISFTFDSLLLDRFRPRFARRRNDGITGCQGSSREQTTLLPE